MFFKALVSVLLLAAVANAYQSSYYWSDFENDNDDNDDNDNNNNDNIQRLSDAVVPDLDGNQVPLTDTQGKCVLIINTGSGCGLTNSNMKWLNTISKRFPELVVIAFPSNSFNQEKKSEDELKD